MSVVNELSTSIERNVADIGVAIPLKTTKAPLGALFHWSE